MGDDSSLGLVTLMIISALGEGVDAEGKASIVEVGVALTQSVERMESFHRGGDHIRELDFALVGGERGVIGVNGAGPETNGGLKHRKGFEVVQGRGIGIAFKGGVEAVL